MLQCRQTTLRPNHKLREDQPDARKPPLQGQQGPEGLRAEGQHGHQSADLGHDRIDASEVRANAYDVELVLNDFGLGEGFIAIYSTLPAQDSGTGCHNAGRLHDLQLEAGDGFCAYAVEGDC